MSKKPKVDNANLYLIGEEGFGEFYPMAKKLETLREGQLVEKFRKILIENGYEDAKKINSMKELIKKLDSLEYEDREEMGLNRDIIKVGTAPRGDEGECPYCGSCDIEWGALEVDDGVGQIYYKCTCNKCDKSFNIWYKPVYVETTKEE